MNDECDNIKYNIKISCNGYVALFENESKFKMIVYVRPIKPKRKYTPFCLLYPETSKILDTRPHRLDFTKISIEFEE